MRRILFAGLSLLLILGAKAQYTITNYASMNEIYCFAEEGNFIWVGTSGGLQKRLKGNGALVSTYTTSNSDLVSNNIRDIHVDPTGAKWIGTFGGGVQKLSGTTWESFNAAQGSAGNLIMDISEDLSGSYWIGTLWYQVIRYNGTMWSHYDNSNGFNANIVYQSLADDFGNVWFATDSGLVKFDINGVFSRLDPTNSNLAEYTVECLAKDNNGNLWIAPSGEGLQKYDILGNIWTTYTTIDGLPSNYVRCMTTDVSGGLWLGTSYGVSRFDGVSSFTNYNTVNTPQFEYNNIWALMTDAEGNLWVGSEEGLLKYTQNTATWSNPMKISNTIKNNQVYDYAQDMNGNHWFATWKGVSKFDGVNWRNYTNADGLGNSNVNAVAVDAHNNKWVGTAGNGATKIDSTNTVFTVYNSGNSQLLQNDVEDIAIDINGNIWFANRNNGLVKFIPSTNTWKTYGLSFGLPTLELLCLAIDQNNDIWVGTGNKGISKFNATNETFENHNASTDFNDVWVYDIDINENNLPVVACNWGLYEFDGSIWNELASLYTPAVMVDSSGYYWYGHSGYYWMGVTKTKDFTTTIEYTTLSGLVDYNIQEIGMDRDNNRWICTGSGISKLTYQAPLVTFTNDSACLPAPICFSNTSTGADAFTDWEWDINGDGSVEYTTPSMSHSFDVSGTYYVKLTGTNEGIPAEYVLPVVVRDIPMVFVSSDPGLSVCSGEEVVLTAHAGSFSGIEWSEDFTGDTLFPTGWTVEGTSTANWDVKPTTHAGGQANELEFFYNPQFFGHSKVITSVIDLSGMPSAALSFVYAVDYYENSFDIGIVFSNDGVSWDTTWKETVSADVSPRSKTISIPPAFLTSTARFAIYFSGNSYDADYIYFDNFSIGGFDEITPLVEEHFSGSALPTGWTAGGEGVSNWKTSSTSNAGGDSPELMLDWSPQFIGSARYASPAINTTGLPEVTVIFNQAVDNYSGSFQIGLATSSDGTTWTPVWQQAITQDIPSEVKTVAISNSDVGSANFQFAFFFSGDSYNINYWYIDNVKVTTGGSSVSYNYLWSNGSNAPIVSVSEPNRYSVDVYNGHCVGHSDTVNVNIAVPYNGEEICMSGYGNTNAQNIVVWEPTANEGISSYNVYRETSVSGMYELLANIPYAQAGYYLDATSQPMLKAYKYKLSIIDTCFNESSASAFHKTILLSITQNVGGGYTLNWNHYEGRTFSSYNIYAGEDSDNMQMVSSVSASSNSFLIANPGCQKFYQIGIPLTTGCSNDSVTISEIFSNIAENNSEIPIPILSIAVDTGFCTNSQILLESVNSASEYLWSNGSTSSSIWVDQPGYYSLTLTNELGCSQSSDSIYITQYTLPTVYITPSSSTTFCEGSSINLTAGGSYGSYEWNTGETTAVIAADSAFTYSVTVTSDDGCSSSAQITPDVHYPETSQEFCIVTVDTIYGKNLVVWEKQPGLGIVSFRIYKESYQAGVYNFVAESPYDSLSVWLDPVSDPATHSDKYKISIVDTCGNESALSSHHKTLHMNISAAVPTGYALTWEHYEGFPFSTYRIFRGNNSGTLTQIDSLAYDPGTFTYVDANPPLGTVFYRVSAVKASPCLGTKGYLGGGGPYSQSLSNLEDTYTFAESVNDNENSFNRMQIFPNPSSGAFTIEFFSTSVLEMRIELLNTLGEVVEVATGGTAQAGRNTFSVGADLAAGVYYVRFTAGSYSEMQKIVRTQ